MPRFLSRLRVRKHCANNLAGNDRLSHVPLGVIGYVNQQAADRRGKLPLTDRARSVKLRTIDRADAPQDLQPITMGKLVIDQYQVEWLFLEAVQRELFACRRRNGKGIFRKRFEMMADQALLHGVIFGVK